MLEDPQALRRALWGRSVRTLPPFVAWHVAWAYENSFSG